MGFCKKDIYVYNFLVNTDVAESQWLMFVDFSFRVRVTSDPMYENSPLTLKSYDIFSKLLILDF